MLLLSLTAISGLAMTGCSALGFESNYDKQVSYEFDSGFEGKDQKVLPEWLPSEAINVKEIVRTTGNERILRAELAGALPPGCVAIAETGKPTPAELSAGLERQQETSTAQEIKEQLDSQYQTPLLSAQWWPTSQEKQTTHLCGKWWVSQDGDTLSAFVPESKAIAENVIAEQAKAQREK